MSEFKRLPSKQYAKLQERESSESKYWKSFHITCEDSLKGSPTCVSFNPVQARFYAVTAGNKICMYDSVTDKIQKSFSQFADEAFSGHFRRDGKLLLAGEKSGTVKVFDVHTKSILRLLKNHSDAVRMTIWNKNGHNIISGSDDKTLKVWDLATQEMLHTYTGHNDYVRCGVASSVSSDVFISGSYDHTLKVWDIRQKSPVAVLQHGSPVESCVTSSSGSLLISGGGRDVKIWDLAQAQCIHTFSHHQKNVTCVVVDGSSSGGGLGQGQRLLSCGLDGHVKVYNLQTMQLTSGLKFASPLSVVATSPEGASGKKLVVGTTAGNLIIRSRGLDAEGTLGGGAGGGGHVADEALDGAGKDASTPAHAHFSASASVVESERKVSRLRPYEAMIKKFQYQLALDGAVRTRNPLAVVAVLEELNRRAGLSIALSGRDEASLEPILSFVSRYICQPRFTRLLLLVTHRLLDMYGNVVGHSDAVDEIFLKLRNQVNSELVFQRSAMKVLGSLEAIVSAASLSLSATSAEGTRTGL